MQRTEAAVPGPPKMSSNQNPWVEEYFNSTQHGQFGTKRKAAFVSCFNLILAKSQILHIQMHQEATIRRSVFEKYILEIDTQYTR